MKINTFFNIILIVCLFVFMQISDQLFALDEDCEDEIHHHKTTALIRNIDCLLEKRANSEEEYNIDILKKYIFKLWNHTLISYVAVDMHLQDFGTGEIIYIYGTSTSGKSTICQLLKEKHPEIPLLTGRNYKTAYIASLVKIIFPKQYEIVLKGMSEEDMVMYLYFGTLKTKMNFNGDIEEISENISYIKNNISEVDKRFDANQLLKMLFSEAFRLSKMGVSVMIDNLDVDFFLRFIGTYNYNFPLRMVLLYCEPDELMRRVHIRNVKAKGRDNLDMRPCLRPLLTFASLYKRIKSPIKASIQEIEPGKLLETYRIGYEIDQQEGLPVWVTTFSNKNKDMWSDLEKYIRKQLKIDSRIDVLRIAPRFPFHILINTKLQPPELALKLIEIK